ncbi:LysR substrate-binding domain-containing protein [Streptomyces sp. NPDC051956]|uniref:LysR substrate-binding domain-containing protein n=1 Tax=Streptomyces sp. NPDC051956 TaxID=3365677 RepID=UPI0037D27700
MGAALFERSPQRVALTGAGAALLQEAPATLDVARGALDALRASRAVVRGTLHIGCLTAVRLLDLPSPLESFHAERPDVGLRLRVSPSGSADSHRACSPGVVTSAIRSLPGVPGRRPAGLTPRQVASVPDGSSSSRPATVQRQGSRPADLADEQFIDFPVGCGNRDLVDRAFATNGIERRVALEVTDISASSAFVRHRVCPGFAAPPDEAGARVLNLVDVPLRFDLRVATATARRPSAALEALLSIWNGCCRRRREALWPAIMLGGL